MNELRETVTLRKHCLPLSLISLLTAFAAAPGVANAAPLDFGGTVRNVLPPGQSGAVPSVPNSADQISLYDGLTPLQGNVGPGAITRYFKSAAFNNGRPRTNCQP